jgi:hypothetical protein
MPLLRSRQSSCHWRYIVSILTASLNNNRKRKSKGLRHQNSVLFPNSPALTTGSTVLLFDLGRFFSFLILYTSDGQLNTSRGPNLTYTIPSRARSSVSFRRSAREFSPPPPKKMSRSQTVKKQLQLNLCV